MPTARPPHAPGPSRSLVRLQKFLAESGIASRRAAEGIIVAGRVEVNGAVVSTLGTKVDPSVDRVRVDGQPIKPKRKQYLALNKPRGYICSRHDPEGRPIVGDLIPREWAHLFPVGRLDYHSEGLLFLTSDGEFALHLTHPRYGVTKKYRATVAGRVEPQAIEQLTQGVFHEGERLRADRARILKVGGQHSLVEVELSEGKNREVRRLFECLHLEVERLQRIQIGPIKLAELPVGKWRMLSAAEIRSLQSPPRAAPAPGKSGASIARARAKPKRWKH